MDLEKSILGVIINDSKAIHKLPELKKEWFRNEANRWLLGILQEKYRKTEAIDHVSLFKHIDKESPYQISDLLKMSRESPVRAANLDQYIFDLKETYLTRKYMVLTGSETNDPFTDLKQHIKKGEDLLEECRMEAHRDLVSIIEDAEKPESPGLKTKPTELNKIDPFKPGRIIFVGGRPSHGKTMAVLSWCKDFCEQGKRVGFFTLEMSDTELVRRLGKSTDYGEMSTWNLDIIDRGGIDTQFIKSQVHSNEYDVIIIDYLQMLKDGRGDSKTYAVEDNVRELKNIAKNENICVIVVSQAGRDIENRSLKRHVMSDFSDSKGIEFTADLAMFVMDYNLWEIEFYRDDTPTDGSLVLQLVKNRHGYIKDIKARKHNLTLYDYESTTVDYLLAGDKSD